MNKEEEMTRSTDCMIELNAMAELGHGIFLQMFVFATKPKSFSFIVFALSIPQRHLT